MTLPCTSLHAASAVLAAQGALQALSSELAALSAPQPEAPPADAQLPAAQLPQAVRATARSDAVHGEQRVGSVPSATPVDAQADAVSQGLPSGDAGATEAPAVLSLTAMALTHLHTQPLQFRPPAQPPIEEPARRGRGESQEHDAEPEPEEAPMALEADVATAELPAAGAASGYAAWLQRLRETAATQAAIREALQALRQGRPLLLAAPLAVPQALACEARAWLLRPGMREVLEVPAQVVFARRPRGAECWSWRARTEPQRTGPSGSACALWLGHPAAAPAFGTWREALLCVPATPRLQRALAAQPGLQLLLMAAPWPTDAEPLR